MPTLFTINSIKIDMYFKEHLPPHFHALYAEHEILIEIKTLETYEGYLPNRQHRMILKWADDPKIQQYLMDVFIKFNPNFKK